MGGSTINTNSTERTKSIQSAMNILNEAIKESRNDVREVLERDYEQLRQSLSAIKPEVKAALRKSVTPLWNVFKKLGAKWYKKVRTLHIL
ncbi:MAG: hypothetical protein IPK68_00950 [Bdellovibrionales bacterium]|nr:hypothetical protein [Bdellovibrionales bacterium]